MNTPARTGDVDDVVLADLPMVDSHHHLFDRGDERYLLTEYLADTAAGHDIRASVYVETLFAAHRDGPEHLRPLGEVGFAADSARRADNDGEKVRAAAGIVGYADLRLGSRTVEYLDRAVDVAAGRLRGVRQPALDPKGSPAPFRLDNPPPQDLLNDTLFQEGFRELAPRGLVFDAAIFHHQMPDVGSLADRFPDTTIVLDHMAPAIGQGLDPSGRDELFDAWRTALFDLARRPNVVCKIGGLGMSVWGFESSHQKGIRYSTLSEVWRPYIHTAIDAFGADRCMMESNFPVDRGAGTYVTVWNALKCSVRDASHDELRALFHDTAMRVYRLDLSGS